MIVPSPPGGESKPNPAPSSVTTEPRDARCESLFVELSALIAITWPVPLELTVKTPGNSVDNVEC